MRAPLETPVAHPVRCHGGPSARCSASTTERSLLTESAAERQRRREPALVGRGAPIGAEPGPGGTHFRVWAPAHEVLDVVLLEPSAGEAPDALIVERRQTVRLEAEAAGYFSGFVPA